MAQAVLVILAVCSTVGVMCAPFKSLEENDQLVPPSARRLWRRFVGPSLDAAVGVAPFGKMRMRRSSQDECEKLQLCKLHARSGHSFLASFQLYFVNKENAKLWDHQVHSAADCERRYSCNGGEERPPRVPQPQRERQYQFIDYDYS